MSAAGRTARLLGALLLAAAGGLILSCSTACAADLAPEILTRVWMEGDKQVASVTLNGDEIARFKGEEDEDDAAEEAEELACKLQELISNKGFDANQLIPSKDQNSAVIKLEGNTVCKFDPFAGSKKPDDLKKLEMAAFDASAKIVNAIRGILGVSLLPATAGEEIAEKIGSKLQMLGNSFSGAASWYGGRFHGRKCSDGSRFDQEKLTAAHRSLPFGTKLLVRNCKTGDSCVVEVNDRGPFIDGRVIDVSKAAAKELHMISSGIAMVECTVLQ